MTIVALGINHKTASVELRERVAFSPEQINDALNQLCHQNGVNEAVVVSTCNRTELYCILENQQPQVLIDWLAEFHKISEAELSQHIYQHQDFSAIQHLMRVSVGLDSLVLGEPQILGQIKQAYAKAKQAGVVNALFERLFQKCSEEHAVELGLSYQIFVKEFIESILRPSTCGYNTACF